MPEQDSSQQKLKRAKSKSAIRNFLFQPKTAKLESANDDAKSLGYVETGEETIQSLMDCVREGRHAMLVGPRGTGKSYMGAQAVRKAKDAGRLGVVQTIEIQGDPNKPPSDYFDDTISFSELGGRLAPSIVNAPFFDLAIRDPKTNKFECRGNDHRIVLRTRDGIEIDRVVLYWDEGNRSSPAMLNAVLGLLAEGRLRRDGVAYTFPPVSCILTRNPDGYDANSAKMPSPLIDRFGVQFYVYNPSMDTFVGAIAPEFLRRQRISLLREAVTAFNRHDYITAKAKKSLRKLLTRAENIIALMPDLRLARVIVKLGRLVEMSGLQKKIDETTVNSPAWIEADFVRAKKTWQRVTRVPLNTLAYRRVAARLAVVVLATWGDLRDLEDKAGMQYLPQASKDILEALAKKDPSVASHLEEVGNLTRYGTSIRAFEEMLKALLAPIVAGRAIAADANPMHIGLEAVRKELGALLGHRCETTFNPDREPAKALLKSKSLLWLAKWILDDRREEEIIALAQLDTALAKSKKLDQ